MIITKTFNSMRCVWGLLLLAAGGCLAPTTQAMDVPAGWDLTFAAQRAEDPPNRDGSIDTYNLYKTIDRQGWQMRYFLQQVPVARLDEAVFVQHKVGTRYGLFIEGERAWLLKDRDHSSVAIRAVEVGAARKMIRRYARRDGPTRHASFQFRESPSCSAEVARAVVSVYVKGKATQYWLSGADFCEIDTDLLSPIKQIMCGGHCRTSRPVALWATKLEEQLLALPPVEKNEPTPEPDRNAVLQQARELLAHGGTVEAMCQATNELLSVSLPDDKIRARTYKNPDEDIDAALVALMGRVDTHCTAELGSPLLGVLVRRARTDVIEAALKAGFPVNEKDTFTPLQAAISEKRPDVQEILIRAGAVRDTAPANQ